MLEASAWFFPAISNPVPWSTEVLMMGSPSETLMVCSKLKSGPGYVWTQPAVGYLNFHLKHLVHHRGQLSAYLRPMGATVPSIYGPSADESM